MDLTSAERAVLLQVRNLFGEASVTSYRLASLVARWPANERASYQAAFDSLVSRGFFIQRAGEQMFSITGAGLKAMV
jgi:hypothetical protein